MPPDLNRRLRPRMTLRQIGVLVAFVAIVLAVVLPMGRSGRGGPWDLAFRVAVELPYILLLPMLFLVRRGPLKNWAVAALCCVPIVAFLAFINGRGLASFAPGVVDFWIAIADALLIAGLAHLGRWVVPRSCPACRRPAMLRDPSVPRSRDFPARSPARSCLACGSRFRRARGGPWVDVDISAPTTEVHPR